METSGVLGLLGDPSRRAIFETLARQPSSVGELAERLPITRQAVSQHLRVLKDGGLVVATAVGTKRIYRLNPEGVDALRLYFQRVWDDTLTSFQKAADQAANHTEGDPMTTTTVADLHGQARVDMTVEEAFAFFTESIGRWWPAEYHIGSSAMVDTILEPLPGGRWYERGDDGSECDWGRVLTWEPPHRIVLTWQINGSWQYDPDPARASEIEIRFIPDGPQQTLVELEHRHLGRLIAGQAMHDAIDQAGGGWSSVLQVYAAAAPH